MKGYKKFCEKLKETNPNVKVSVKELFESNLDLTKEFTQFITPESDDEEEAVDEEAKPEGDEEAPPEDAKEEEKGAKSKLSKKGKESEAVIEEDAAPIDINAEKFIPGLVHIKKEVQANSSGVQQIANYTFTLKADDAFGLIVEDNQIDSLNSDIVDFAFGCGAVSHINLTGFGKPEKSAKVKRFAQILEYLSH